MVMLWKPSLSDVTVLVWLLSNEQLWTGSWSLTVLCFLGERVWRRSRHPVASISRSTPGGYCRHSLHIRWENWCENCAFSTVLYVCHLTCLPAIVSFCLWFCVSVCLRKKLKNRWSIIGVTWCEYVLWWAVSAFGHKQWSTGCLTGLLSVSSLSSLASSLFHFKLKTFSTDLPSWFMSVFGYVVKS